MAGVSLGFAATFGYTSENQHPTNTMTDEMTQYLAGRRDFWGRFKGVTLPPDTKAMFELADELQAAREKIDVLEALLAEPCDVEATNPANDLPVVESQVDVAFIKQAALAVLPDILRRCHMQDVAKVATTPDLPMVSPEPKDWGFVAACAVALAREVERQVRDGA
jgi:hypothetical protein